MCYVQLLLLKSQVSLIILCHTSATASFTFIKSITANIPQSIKKFCAILKKWELERKFVVKNFATVHGFLFSLCTSKCVSITQMLYTIFALLIFLATFLASISTLGCTTKTVKMSVRCLLGSSGHSGVWDEGAQEAPAGAVKVCQWVIMTLMQQEEEPLWSGSHDLETAAAVAWRSVSLYHSTSALSRR